MIIDFHTHTFPEAMAKKTLDFLSAKGDIKAYTKATNDSLIDSMEENNIDISVVLPIATKISQFDTINRIANETNTKYEHTSKRIISFGSIHPKDEDYKEKLKTIKELNLKGIKLHPDYQQTFIDDTNCMKIIEEANKLDLAVIIHAGFDPGYPELTHATPKRILNVINNVHPKKFILAHMGSNEMWTECEELLVGKDVYFDTAICADCMEREQFKRMILNHGSDKILFGSDSPWSSQGFAAKAIIDMNIPKEFKANILYKNALKLLNLKM